MSKEKGKNISVRLDGVYLEKLEKIMQARGLDMSAAIRQSILEIPILQIGDVTNLAQEFCKIRIALEQGSFDEEIRKEVNSLCQSMYVLMENIEKTV